MAHVAASRALACAGLASDEVELIVYGSCSNDELVPNSASGLQIKLGAGNAAAMDVNTACTSFLYALSTATAMIRTGVVSNAVVVGVELISPFMDWMNRGVAVLFGDGAAAVVLQASEREEGVLAEKLGCFADARQTLRVRGMGTTYANRGVFFGDTLWDFDGQEISSAPSPAWPVPRRTCLRRADTRSTTSISSTPPGEPADHRIRRQADRRAAGARIPHDPALRQHVGGDGAGRARRGAGRRADQAACVDPHARVRRRSHLVLAFSSLGRRTTPLATTDIDLPPCPQTALDRVRELIVQRSPYGRSIAGLTSAKLAEAS